MTDQIQGEIVLTEPDVRLGSLQTTGADDVIYQASIIAKSLADVVNDRKLYNVISGKKHVRVEGWTTLGAMLGILPREVDDKTIRLEDGSYKAYVELVRISDGAIVGGASSICGMDEKTWKNRPEYARQSMAVTRATGKAFRLGFSWIMTLAGYEATPAEEMPEIVEGKMREPKTEPQTEPAPESNGKDDIYQAIYDTGLSQNVHSAKTTLTKYCKTGYDTVEKAVAWFTLYRGWRDSGKTVAQAASKANNGDKPE
jgi:hypothetical protein